MAEPESDFTDEEVAEMSLSDQAAVQTSVNPSDYLALREYVMREMGLL